MRVIVVDPSTRALLTLARERRRPPLPPADVHRARSRRRRARAGHRCSTSLLGWTGVAWVCALVLALGPKRPQPPAAPPTRPSPRPAVPRRAARPIYVDGVYLVSSGPDTHTWAIREDGRWRIVYEIGGEERLVGDVAETRRPAERARRGARAVGGRAMRPSRIVRARRPCALALGAVVVVVIGEPQPTRATARARARADQRSAAVRAATRFLVGLDARDAPRRARLVAGSSVDGRAEQAEPALQQLYDAEAERIAAPQRRLLARRPARLPRRASRAARRTSPSGR